MLGTIFIYYPYTRGHQSHMATGLGCGAVGGDHLGIPRGGKGTGRLLSLPRGDHASGMGTAPGLFYPWPGLVAINNFKIKWFFLIKNRTSILRDLQDFFYVLERLSCPSSLCLVRN